MGGGVRRPPRDLAGRGRASGFVVLIDGIDEAMGWNFERDFPLPHSGPGLKIVFAARRLVNRDIDEWREALGLSPDTETIELALLSRQEVAALVDRWAPASARGDPALARQLSRVSQGDPLLLRLLVRELAATGWHAAALSTSRPGWHAYVKRWYAEQREQWRNDDTIDAPAVQRGTERLLELLATARGPVLRDDICALGDDLLSSGSRIAHAIDALRRFQIADADGASMTYVFAHPRLRYHFAEDEWMTKEDHRVWERRYLDLGRANIAD